MLGGDRESAPGAVVSPARKWGKNGPGHLTTSFSFSVFLFVLLNVLWMQSLASSKATLWKRAVPLK